MRYKIATQNPAQLKSQPSRWSSRRSGCHPKLDFLKAAAKRAKLNRENVWLHKFRATFATWLLWAVDLRTVQQWLGHSGMESTMRYLKPLRSQQVREKVNEIFG